MKILYKIELSYKAIIHVREHLQTDFCMLNVIMVLTSDPTSLVPHYESNLLAIEAQSIILFT